MRGLWKRAASVIALIAPVETVQAAEQATDGTKITCSRYTDTRPVSVDVRVGYTRQGDRWVSEKAFTTTTDIHATAVSGPYASMVDLDYSKVSFLNSPVMERNLFSITLKEGAERPQEGWSIAIVDRDGIERWSSGAQTFSANFSINKEAFLSAERPSVLYKRNGEMLATLTFPTGSRAVALAQAEAERGRVDAQIAKADATIPEGCSSDCFFTTAAVHTIGLEDDCWELRTLRSMRDRLSREGGASAALVRQYRDHAPRIVRAVERRADRRRIWVVAYWRGVVPASLLHRLGMNALSVRVYEKLYARLDALARG